jgi:hypothetical protein
MNWTAWVAVGEHLNLRFSHYRTSPVETALSMRVWLRVRNCSGETYQNSEGAKNLPALFRALSLLELKQPRSHSHIRQQIGQVL